MLIIIGVLVSLTTIVVMTNLRLRRPWGVASLGVMSERWLAEQRASRS